MFCHKIKEKMVSLVNGTEKKDQQLFIKVKKWKGRDGEKGL
jgi:hypothetical protein